MHVMYHNDEEEEDDDVTDETLALTTSHTTTGKFNTSRNCRHRTSLPPQTAIGTMTIIFVVVSAFISYTQKDNIAKVFSRRHFTIWGSRQSSNTGTPLGIHGTNATSNFTESTSNVDHSNHHRPRTQPSNNSRSTTGRTDGRTDPIPTDHPSLPQNHSKPTHVEAFLPWNLTSESTQEQLPKPHSIQMIYQYYKMHSVAALRQDLSSPRRLQLEDNDETTHRTFSLAFLPCIRHNQYNYSNNNNNLDEELSYHYTSEILHNFFNTLVWSIMTNRTVIVQWYDPTGTHEPSRNHIHLKNASEQFYTCTAENQQNQPRSLPVSILSLASWMVQWSDVLLYHPTTINETIVPIPIDLYRQQYDTRHSVVVFPQSQEHFHIHPSPNPQPVMFYNHWFQHPLSDNSGIQYVKYLPEWNRHVTLELYNEGSDFLYGALFRICFPEYDQSTLDKMISTLPTASTRKNNQPSNDVVSFVLVSVPESSNIINIESEIKCLRQFLPLSDDPTTCKIVLLSSNPTMVERITDWITSSKRQCTVLHTSSKANENDESKNRRPESDSFSGNAPSVDSNDDNKSDDGNDDDGTDDDEDDDEDEVGDGDDDNDDKGSRKRNAISKHGNRKAKKQMAQSGSDSASHNGRIPLLDIAMAAKIVRTGVIGYTDHPDFQLLVEWIAYHRQIEYYDNNNQHDDRSQRHRRTISIATSASDSIEPLLWCEL